MLRNFRRNVTKTTGRPLNNHQNRPTSRGPSTAALNSFTNRANRSSTRWMVSITVLGLITILAINQAFTKANVERDRWGDISPVLVATSDVEAGAVIGAENFAQASYPTALVPAGGVASLSDLAVGTATANAISKGMPLTTGQVLTTGGRYPLTPTGHVAVAVPRGPAVVDAAKGDLVQVIVRDHPSSTLFGPTSDPPADGSVSPKPSTATAAQEQTRSNDNTEVTAQGATGSTPTFAGIVVDATEERLTIALTKQDAIDVGQAVLSGSVGVMYQQVG